jgi:hypothetical protein
LRRRTFQSTPRSGATTLTYIDGAPYWLFPSISERIEGDGVCRKLHYALLTSCHKCTRDPLVAHAVRSSAELCGAV